MRSLAENCLWPGCGVAEALEHRGRRGQALVGELSPYGVSAVASKRTPVHGRPLTDRGSDRQSADV